MAVEWTSIRNHQVARDDTNTWRWFAAVGPSIVQYEINTAGEPTDDTTGMPTAFTYTLVNGSTFAHDDTAGGSVTLTCDTAENDGIQLQLGDELGGAGENVSFAAEYFTYFGCQIQVNDADQVDAFLGFAITDTTILGGATDSIGFRTVDESATLNFVLEKDSAETLNQVDTLVDATDVTLEFYYSGSNVYVYVDGTLTVTIADTDVGFPNDELLRLSIALLTGEAVANTLTIKWLRFFQIQA
jgi:hypothetical protein